MQKIRDLSWEYESGLLVVDTFSEKIAVIQEHRLEHYKESTGGSVQEVGWQAKVNLLRRRISHDIRTSEGLVRRTEHRAQHHPRTRPLQSE